MAENKLPEKMPAYMNSLEDMRAVEIATLGGIIALGRVLNDVIDITIKLATEGGVSKEHEARAKTAKKIFQGIIDSHKVSAQLSIDELAVRIKNKQEEALQAYIEGVKSQGKPKN